MVFICLNLPLACNLLKSFCANQALRMVVGGGHGVKGITGDCMVSVTGVCRSLLADVVVALLLGVVTVRGRRPRSEEVGCVEGRRFVGGLSWQMCDGVGYTQEFLKV